MDNENTASPSYERDEYKKMEPRWQLLNALLEIEADIRKSKHKGVLLPPMPSEDPDVYKDRIENTFLWNSVEQTLDGMVGLITSNGHSVDSIKDEELKKQILTPGRGRTSLKNFVTKFTEAVCKYGHALILVSPPANNLKNKAQEKFKDIRPYWSIYIPENILNWRTDETGLASEANMIVLREYVEKADGTFGVSTVERYIVLEKGKATVYEEDKENENPIKIGAGVFTTAKGAPLDYIPATIAYYNQIAPFVSKPPLNSLANQSLEHTRLKSNSNLAIRMHQFPVAVFQGLDDKDSAISTIKLGPTVGLQLPMGASFKFEETTGRALETGLKQIEKNEQLQNEMSFKHLIGDNNISRDVSATEAYIKNYQKLSPLAKAAFNIMFAVQEAIKMHAEYLGIELDNEEQFKINFDIKNMSVSTDHVRVMIELVQNNVVPRSLVYEKLTNGTWFDTVESYEESRVKVLEETMEALNADQTI